MFCVGGIQLIVALPFAAGTTAMLKAGRLALPPRPSLAEMLMLLYVPTCAALGVPLSAPVDVLNDAQAGALLTLNVSVSPSGSLTAGVNKYELPANTCGLGLPPIVGAPLDEIAEAEVEAARTSIGNAGSDAVLRPSLTEITMLTYVPESVLCGAPPSAPL